MGSWIRKGDRVLVIAGNDKGKVGEVLKRIGGRVLLQGINIRKKHLRRTQEAQGGRIVDMEVPIDISNVCLCNKEGKRLRLHAKIEKNGERMLVSRVGSKEVVYRSVKKPA